MKSTEGPSAVGFLRGRPDTGKEHHVLDVNSHSTFLRYYPFAAHIEGWDDLKCR
jgi:hypothetical protein